MTESSGPLRLLVVDDERLNRELLARRLRAAGYEVAVAEQGADALARVAEGPFDLVVLDIMMPGIDGLEVLRRIRKHHSPAHLPVIMASAKDESGDVIAALRLGANDYVTKPVDFDVLQARIQTQVGLKRKTEALEAANLRMQEELQAAAEIQKSLLPHALPKAPGVRLAWTYRPCEELAGDILNVFKLDAGHLGMYLLDVCGHGVPAALMSSALSHLLSPNPGEGAVLWEHLDAPDGPDLVAPSRVAERLNARFDLDLGTSQFFSLHYGILDLSRRAYRFVSAGHPHPLLLRAGAEARFIESASPAIAIIDNPEYREQQIDLQDGDRLIVYSDGIFEARDEAGEEFGPARLVEALQAAGDSDIDHALSAVVAAVEAWTAGSPQDDVSMVALEIQ